jgi:type I restriction enzyme, S subunit
MSDNWEVAALEDFAIIEMGQSPSGETCNQEGIGLPLLNGPTEFGGYHPTPVQFTTDPRKYAFPGDMLFCVRGSTTGRMNWADQKYAIGRGLAAIRHRSGSEYRYFLKAIIDFRLPELLASATGSTFPNVSREQLANLQCEIPSLPEQRTIAEMLGALDDKIELNRRMNRTLESMARAVFRQWFVENEEAKGWDLLPLSRVCKSIFSGGTPSTANPEYWNGGIPWLSSGETRERFIIDTEKTITQAGVDNSSTRFARAGSTVIAAAGQGKTRGQTSLLMFDTYINQSVVVLNANKNRLSDLFLFFGLSGRYEQFRQLSDSHSSRGSLTTQLLRELQINVPHLERVLEFDRFSQPIVEQIYENLQQSRTLASLRDTLLPKLMRGEVRVKDLEKQL